jgi:hypothetical protein
MDTASLNKEPGRMSRSIRGVVNRFRSPRAVEGPASGRSLAGWLPLGFVLALAALVPVRLSGQDTSYDQVISANPFGLILLWFNAEYERGVSDNSTLGVGGSLISAEDDETEEDEEYLNADLFWRFYPGGNVYDGWAFGAKAGLTRIADEGSFFGFGFDVNRSWLLGANDNFYVGVGFGLKRLVGTGDRDLELEVIPTVRLVNIGIAF